MKKHSKQNKTNKIPIFYSEKTNDPFFHHYNFFINNLTILSRLNEIFSGSFDTYVNTMAKQSFSKKTSNLENVTFDVNKEKIEELMKSLHKMPRSHIVLSNEFLEFMLSSYQGTFYLKESFHGFLREMILVILVSLFEQMLESNFLYVFQIIPDLLKSKEKTIDYEELLKLGSFDLIMGRIMNKEAQSITREDIEKINQILNKKYEIIDLSITSDWKNFKERFYRRNLIIHHMSMVDDNYRMKTRYTGKDDQLNTDDKYLKESLLLFANYSRIMTNAFASKYIPIILKRIKNSQTRN